MSRIKVTGAQSLIANLHRIGANVEKVALEAVQEATELVKTGSQQRCPVDTYDLEKAHATKYKTFRSSGRTVGYIYIDDALAAHQEQHSAPVSEYSWYVHEGMQPYGPIQRGPKTQAKAAGSPVVVGGKFLQNSTTENEAAVMELITSKLLEAMKC